MKYRIYFPPYHVSVAGASTMSGSFMLFCIIVFFSMSFVISNTRDDFGTKTILFLRFVQAFAVTGAIAEPLTGFFNESVAQGFAVALFIGIVFLILTTNAIRIAAQYFGANEGSFWPQEETNSPKLDDDVKE